MTYIDTRYIWTFIGIIILNLLMIFHILRKQRIKGTNKLFDLVPVARNKIMESMADGIVVLDLKNWIVDMNPSAYAIFDYEAIDGIGHDAIDFFKLWTPLLKLVLEDGSRIEFEYVQNKRYQYYEVSCLPLKDERGNFMGKLLVIHDVTEKKMTDNELVLKQQEMAVKEERERKARDLHDNFGQIMCFVNVQTQAVREYLKHDQVEMAVQCLRRLTEVSQQVHNTVRETILSMREETIAGKGK